MDREEKLRAAKEKFKKFQKKRQETHSITPTSEVAVDHENGSSRSTPMEGEPLHQANTQASEDPPLFTFDSKAYPEIDPFATTLTAVEDEKSISSSSVSDQIDQVLASRRISDVASDDLELAKVRISQLEKEKSDVFVQSQQQRQRIQQLEASLNLSNGKVVELVSELEDAKLEHKKWIENEDRTSKSQLDSHAESIQILVSEKSELQATLRQLQREHDKTVEEVRSLKESKSSHKERTCACTDRVFLAEVERKRLSETLSNLRDERDRLKIDVIDYKQEVLELRSKVDFFEKNTSALAKQLTDTTSKLELAEVNLSQLRASNCEDEEKQAEMNAEPSKELLEKNEELSSKLSDKESEITRLASENDEHVKRVAELTAYIQQASQDREQIIQQYTNYSQQLASQIESLTQQLHVKANDNHNFATREADLVAHVERLESQLQKQMQQDQPSSNPTSEKEISVLRSQAAELDQKILSMQLERDSLQEAKRNLDAKLTEAQHKIHDHEATISDLETKLEMSKEFSSAAEASQHKTLLAASSSDKVAASRAMKQNQELKKQVEELENAVIQVTNTKAELLTELEDVKLKLKKSDDSESSLRSLHNGLLETVKERDRTINRLKDQAKYYVAFAEQSVNIPVGESRDDQTIDPSNIVKELAEAKEEIRCLISHNSELKSQLEVILSKTPTPANEAESTSSSSSASLSSEDSEVVAIHTHENENNNVSSEIAVPEEEDIKNQMTTPVMSQDVAFLKVEQKLKLAMQKIADLTSEKENLEHIIVRLQDETDTVGEYITIYQYQRAQQKAQLQEKEKQLHSVARDREELKVKLAQLQGLLTQYLDNSNASVNGDHAQLLENGASQLNGGGDLEVAQEANEDAVKKTEAAGKILSLLSEIGANEMLTCDEGNFAPWFWEPSQGRLMNV